MIDGRSRHQLLERAPCRASAGRSARRGGHRPRRHLGTVEEHDGHGVARLVGGGEGDDPRVRPLRLAGVELRGPRLGGDRDAAVELQAAARRAVGGDALHQRVERRRRLAVIGRSHSSGRRASACAPGCPASRRRRTASSSPRCWRRRRRPSPCARGPSGPPAGRSRASPAAGGCCSRLSVCRTCSPAGRGRRRSDPLADAPGLHAVDHVRDADVERGLGERDVAAAAEHLAQVAAAVRAVVVLDQRPAASTRRLARTGCRGSPTPVSRAMPVVSTLNVEPGTALLVGVGQQRVARRLEEFLERGAGGVEVRVDDAVRVVRRVAVHRQHGAGLCRP